VDILIYKKNIFNAVIEVLIKVLKLASSRVEQSKTDAV
jgi:hypothetical protein